MRISGGVLRGRTLRVPGRGVRPSSERVREAVFSMLGERVVGAAVLDLFAGSGALGLEAWSRGAEAVDFVEKDREAAALLEGNLRALAAGDEAAALRCYAADALAFARNARRRIYDLVFADPPYHEDWLVKLAPVVAGAGLLAPGGVLVFEQHRSETSPEGLEGWDPWRDKLYGTTRVLMFLRAV